MLHSRSISCQFAGILILISSSLELVTGKDARPNYDEFYNTRAAAAIKDIGSGKSDLLHAASSRLLKYVEAEDQVPHEAKQQKKTEIYEVPRDTLAKFALEEAYEDEIDALDREYSSPTVYKLDAVKVSDTQKEDPQEYNSGSGESREKPKSSYYVKKTKYSKPKTAPVKESSEEESYIPRYKESHYQVSQTKTAAPTEAPYKNYKSYTSKPVTSASHDEYHITPSESKLSNCEEVEEKSNDKEPGMKCVVCKDPKTGFKSRQCSYSSASEPEAYFITKSAKYSQPHKAVNERFKRYALEDDHKDFDPYEHFKAESQKHFSYDAGDFFKDFKFPSYYSGDTLEKSESEIQSEKLMKDGGVCKEVKRNDMTCKVCKNEKTGGNFETCSYSSVPSEKKYAFVSEKKSDGNSESPRKDVKAKETKVVERKFQPRTSESVKEDKKSGRGSGKATDEDSYSVPEHFAEQTKQLNERSNRYDGRQEDKDKHSHSGDEYYNKIFNSKPAASEEKQSYTPESGGKDVEKVLEEFAKKDRSSCKKAVRNGMTCYLCVNKDGTQHEECMYVTNKQPQNRHIAYHEVEQVKSNKHNPATAASTISQVTVQKRKRPIKKVYSNTQASPSIKVTTTTKLAPGISTGSIINGKFRQPRKLRRTQNYSGADAAVEETRSNPIVTLIKPAQRKTPAEPIGASSDPKYIYSKELGVSLPRYLLEESDYEKSYKRRS